MHKIHIIAKPKSKIEKIIHVWKDLYDIDTYEVYISDLPQNWQANTAIIKSLAKYFNKPQSYIKIISWHRWKDKLFEIL